jgi:hypothetical protein
MLSLAHCLGQAQPIGFNESWRYLEAKLHTSRESPDFLIPAIDLLEQERGLHLDLDLRYAALRRRQKRSASRLPGPDDVTPGFPMRWHGDERQGAIHTLRCAFQRFPLADHDDHPRATYAFDVAQAVATEPKVEALDLDALQESLTWARSQARIGHASQDRAQQFRADRVLRYLGQIYLVLNGAPALGVPWNFTVVSDETERRASVARASLTTPVGLWRSAPSGNASSLVDAASDLLVLGYNTPALRELAGLSKDDGFFVVEPILATALEQLGASDLLDEDTERAGLRARLDLLLDNKITVRELSSWSHGEIGHEGEDDLQPFVLLDDVYDDWEQAGEDLAYLESVTRKAAYDFLAGRPVSRLDGVEPPTPRTIASIPPVDRLSWRDRLWRWLRLTP